MILVTRSCEHRQYYLLSGRNKGEFLLCDLHINTHTRTQTHVLLSRIFFCSKLLNFKPEEHKLEHIRIMVGFVFSMCSSLVAQHVSAFVASNQCFNLSTNPPYALLIPTNCQRHGIMRAGFSKSSTVRSSVAIISHKQVYIEPQCEPLRVLAIRTF